MFFNAFPTMNRIVTTDKIEFDKLELDVGYEINDLIFLKSDKVVSIVLPHHYLEGIEIEFGQAAKCVRGLVDSVLADNLIQTTGQLWPSVVIQLQNVDYAAAYIAKDGLNSHMIERLVDWFNNRPKAVTKKLFYIAGETGIIPQSNFDGSYVPVINEILADNNYAKITPDDQVIRLSFFDDDSYESIIGAIRATIAIPDVVLMLNFERTIHNRMNGMDMRFMSMASKLTQVIDELLALQQIHQPKAIIWYGSISHPEKLNFLACGVLEKVPAQAIIHRRTKPSI